MAARQTLEKILHSQGFGSRKACRALIRDGRVAVAGTVVENPEQAYSGEELAAPLSWTVDGEAWSYRERVYLLLHKPEDMECSHQPTHHPSVFTLLPEPLRNRGVQCVGRLDADTTGLLLLTDDGQFIHALSSPKRQVVKVYRAVLKHPADGALCEGLLAGVVLRDDPRPAQALAASLHGERELELAIGEGRYHQVKRMVAAVGNRVESLCRVAVGALVLPADLAPGQWRHLTQAELAGFGF